MVNYLFGHALLRVSISLAPFLLCPSLIKTLCMKSSSPTTSISATVSTTFSRWVSASIIISLMVAAHIESSSIALQETYTTTQNFPNYQPQVRKSHSSSSSLPHLFLQHRKNYPLQPLPPSGKVNNEIDPRYGIEKRLVPSGPNPLHN